MAKSKQSKREKLGLLEPKYRFFLNPYTDLRFSTCPICGQKTKIRKHPFGIHIDPQILLTLNMTGPFCPACDLIILHQDKVEDLLARTFHQRQPEILGNDYFIMGTVELAYWRKASKKGGTYEEFFANLHEFREQLKFKIMQGGWQPKE
jgi:hypothetical protein